MTSYLAVAISGAVISYILYTRITLYIARRRLKAEHGCQPCNAQNHKDPVLGLDVVRMLNYNSKHHIMLEEGHKRFERLGNTYHNRIITSPWIITREPENIKAILSTNFKDFSFGNRHRTMTPLLGHGIFNADGERWANSRHMLRPNFGKDQVADVEMFERHFKLMLKHIPRDGSTVDLQALFFSLTIDTATEFLFNHSSNTLRMFGQEGETNEDTLFGQAFNYAQYDCMLRMRYGVFDRFRKNEKGWQSIKICHEYIEKYVDEALRFRKELDKENKAGLEKNGRYFFIQEVVKQTTDKERIRDELINILLAGRDTTASLLSNMFFQLAKRPDLYAKLRKEVEKLGDRLPTYQEVRNMTYLKWCMNESLRTHPVVPSNSRLAIRDTVFPLGGGSDGKHPLLVPKGTTVGFSIYGMHRRKDFYGEDADEYRPERWEHLRPGWEYLPFNGGPRICLGKQHALTEAGYITARIVQEFSKIESRDPGPWRESLTLTLCSMNGTKVGLTPA